MLIAEAMVKRLVAERKVVEREREREREKRSEEQL